MRFLTAMRECNLARIAMQNAAHNCLEKRPAQRAGGSPGEPGWARTYSRKSQDGLAYFLLGENQVVDGRECL
jgi:hypothetical protein